MSNKSSKKARSSAQILAEIAALPPSVQGTISSYKNVRKNGTAAVYYNLQYSHQGKNHSFAIPVDKVEDFKAAVAAGRKLKDLVLELSLANARELASAETPLNGQGKSRPFQPYACQVLASTRQECSGRSQATISVSGMSCGSAGRSSTIWNE